MNMVITMAGMSKRFFDAGYKIPKYMLKAHGKTLFYYSLLSLADFFSPSNKFIFIVKEQDNAKKFIKDECLILGIENYSVIELDYQTSGQAETALLASSCWEPEDKLLIYNIDTFVEPHEIKPVDLMGDGCIPCFSSQGDNWSFVKLNSENKAVEVTEKKRISDNCSIGAYYFKSCNLFVDLYKRYFYDSEHKTEKYIAPIYNELIKQSGNITIVNLPSDKVHVLGTPEEFEKFASAVI